MQVTDFNSQTRSHRESQQDTYSTDLFTQCRKFSKPIKNPADHDGTRCYVIILNTLSVSLLLIVAAALFLAAGLRGEAKKELNGMYTSDCRNHAKINCLQIGAALWC